MAKQNLPNALTHLGREQSGDGRSVNLPLMQSSTLLFDSLSAFESSRENRYNCNTLYYGRYGNPASFELEKMMAQLEQAEHCISLSSGLTAISVALMAACGSGTHLLVADNVYGPTRLFCDSVLKRYGVEITYFCSGDVENLEMQFKPNTAAVMFEAPGTGTFEIPDIPGIAKLARKKGAISILDGTWATPVFCQPMKLGVDIVVHSGSKYIGGHSDVMIGFIVCNHFHYDQMRRMALAIGDRAGSQDIFLTLRGLRSLELRMLRHQASAMKLAEWLSHQHQVLKVLHPAFPECPGHEYWTRDFSGSSGLFSVLFKPCSHQQLTKFVDGLRMFSVGLSWGGYESLALPVDPSAFRTAKPWTEKGQLVRFSIGNEAVDDLITDIDQSLHYLAGE